MSTRKFEVSFRAELDDRQVDALADTLWELGYDALCFRPLPPPRAAAEFCPTCVGVCNCAEHHSRADTTADRDARRAALQHEQARELKW